MDMDYELPDSPDLPLFPTFDENLDYCRRLKGDSADVNIRELVLAGGLRCAVISVDGMSNQELIEHDIILAARRHADSSGGNKFDPADGVIQMLAASAIEEEKLISKAFAAVLSGDVLVLIEGAKAAYICGYRAFPSRGVGESPLEGNLRGPHEAFTENARTNTTLIRRRITDPNLTMEHLSVGRRSSTTVVLCYIKGVVHAELVNEVRDKINAIDIDIINDAGEIEQLLETGHFKSKFKRGLFPLVDGSEMPDLVARDVSEGRLAIIVGGSPYVLVVPSTLDSLMRVGEDEYQRWSISTYVKLLRWAALIISVIGPALYVAIVAYHPGLLPTDLLIITARNRADVPFSAITEVLLLEFFLELLREAAIRMPKGIGTSLSIVGGLIIGDSAIKAGLISPFLIIIIGLTTIAGFTIPSYSLASSFRLVKYFLLLMSGMLGVLGVTVGTVLTVSAMVGARSFGTDFTSPFTPLRKQAAAASLIELPIRLRTRRPEYLDPINETRFRD